MKEIINFLTKLLSSELITWTLIGSSQLRGSATLSREGYESKLAVSIIKTTSGNYLIEVTVNDKEVINSDAETLNISELFSTFFETKKESSLTETQNALSELANLL